MLKGKGVSPFPFSSASFMYLIRGLPYNSTKTIFPMRYSQYFNRRREDKDVDEEDYSLIE
jgi:hypothetical protein